MIGKRNRLNVVLSMVLAVVMAVSMALVALPDRVHAEPEAAVSYTLNATLKEGLPGVYAVKAKVGDSKEGENPSTIGIPSVAKQTLANAPTKESPAILTGAAVNYETKTGPTEFTPIPGAELVAPYSYFRWGVMEEQRQEPDGSTSVHKKLTGFDGTYYIIRVDVSDIIEGKTGFLHVKQESNKAMMVALGMEGTTFADGLGSKTGAYALKDGAIALKDTTGKDKEVPYFDVIVLSSSKLVAGADQGQSTAPDPDIKLSFYVDETDDYNPELVYDPASTDVNHVANCLKKFFDDTKLTPENNASSYIVKGSDLEIDVMVDDLDVTGEQPDFWSMTKAFDYMPYDSHVVKLICEVPVLEGLHVQGDASTHRAVKLDVNSFDIQIANNTTTGSAGLVISNNAELDILDGTKTSGAELAIGNNATMVIEPGGSLIIDESCTAEVEYDAATTTGGTDPSQLINGEITIKEGGKLINRGVVNIEGKEAKPLDPNAQEQQEGQTVTTDMRSAIMLIESGGVLENYGCLSLKGILYVLGTLTNYGKYNETIIKNDPDKGEIAYHRGIQIFWKDDVRVEGVEPGILNIGIGPDNTTNPQAVFNNYGDVVLTPGTLNLYGIFNNMKDPAGTDPYVGHFYLSDVDEAIVPITPTAEAPTVVEERVKIPLKKSVFAQFDGSTFNNQGVMGYAKVALIHNGILGDLTPVEDPTETPGWHQTTDGQWYYINQDGVRLKGWLLYQGFWYYLDPSTGIMHTGWLYDGGAWYYLFDSGAMATGWHWINNAWYFLTANGSMAANEWIGGYWLNADGSWTYQPTARWYRNAQGWWYGDTSGWYASNCIIKIDTVAQRFNAAGYWVPSN